MLDLSQVDKKQLLGSLLRILQQELEICIRAAVSAREAATHEELIAENKYDTKGLEASYLAGAQARRANAIQLEMDELSKIDINSESPRIGSGSLVALLDLEDEQKKYVLLLPQASGQTLDWNNQQIVCLSPASPLGKALWGREAEDEVSLKTRVGIKTYQIIDCK